MPSTWIVVYRLMPGEELREEVIITPEFNSDAAYEAAINYVAMYNRTIQETGNVLTVAEFVELRAPNVTITDWKY